MMLLTYEITQAQNLIQSKEEEIERLEDKITELQLSEQERDSAKDIQIHNLLLKFRESESKQ